MSHASKSTEAELPLSSNVQELRPVSDRMTVIEPKPVAVPPVAPRASFKQLMMAGVAAAFLMGAGLYGWDYWTVGRYLVSTDDAYVKADNTTVAPKVSGYLSEVLVNDNEPVKAGEVLARIDDRDYRVALDQAKADVAAAEAALASKRAQLEVQQAVIAAAKATLEVDIAAETFAGQENKRYSDLAKTGFGSVQNAQLAQSRDASALAAIERDNANLASAQKGLVLLNAEIAQAIAASARAGAIERQAELNLGYTTISAPIAGVVGNRTLRTGQFVQAGTQLMSLVPTADTYVIANFKETQLTHVRNGQPVVIAVDMFPGHVVHGHVDSLAPASGQEFALLPPDNATGNFTKVVQRIPVKIALDGETAVELRPGMSVIPTIHTKANTSEASQHINPPAMASLGSSR